MYNTYSTLNPIKYAYGLLAFCFTVVISIATSDSSDIFTHDFRGVSLDSPNAKYCSSASEIPQDYVIPGTITVT